MLQKDIFSLLSYLLQYPHENWLNMEQFRREIDDCGQEKIGDYLRTFFDYLEHTPLNVLEANFVETFDFSKKTTLYLLYPQYGEDRKRIEILLEIVQEYEKGGLKIGLEMPDYLPLVLEALAIVEVEQVKKILKHMYHGIKLLHVELVKIDSPYANLLDICLIAVNSLFGEMGGMETTC